MDPVHLVEHHQKESWYWWHVNKRRLVVDYLERSVEPGARILEVGCGGGYLCAALAKAGYHQVAADISRNAARFTRDRGVADVLVFDATTSWPLPEDSFDAVLMLDVLEHLDDDLTALSEAQRVLRPGGALVVTVPAHQFLFSAWDRLVGHRRRYSRGQLTRAARHARLQPSRLTAWNVVSFLPAVVLRTKDRLFGSTMTHAAFPAVSPALNAGLKGIGWVERLLCRYLNLRCGLSFAAVLSKPSRRS
jgi:SAM-dependent methyltransferase